MTVFDPLLALSTLVTHQVRFIVVGGFSGALWGSPTVTMDLDIFTFDTTAGSLDCLGTPSGTHGYADLVRNASQVDLGGDLRVDICSLQDLLRMKRAAGRPKDQVEVEILSALAEEREKSS
jgi:hypothetical protein